MSLCVIYVTFSVDTFVFIAECAMTINIVFAVTGMSPLSPYLNVDPRYLVQVSLSLNKIVPSPL